MNGTTTPDTAPGTTSGRRHLLARFGLLGVSSVAVAGAVNGALAPTAAADPSGKSRSAALVDVTDTGAKGNGRGNDAPGIQAAIDLAAKLGGGTVFLPALTYRLGRRLRLRSGVTLTSTESRANITLTSGFSDDFVIEADSVRGVTISNLSIDCDERAALAGGVHVNKSTDVRLDSLSIKGISHGNYEPDPGIGSTQLILVKDCQRVDVVDCVLRQAYVGLLVTGNGSHITIDRCDIAQASYFGIHILGGLDSHTEFSAVRRCRLTEIGGRPGDVGYPIYITCGGNRPGAHKHRYILVSENEVIGNKLAYGHGGNADLIAPYDVHDGVIERNVVLYGGDAGISPDRCRRLVISDNRVGYCNTSGINIWRTSDVTVVGNLSYNNYQDYAGDLNPEPRGGIRTYMPGSGPQCQDILIVGNRCWDDQETKTQDYGIYLRRNTKRVTVGSNLLDGNRDGMFRSAADEVTTSFVVTVAEVPTAGYWEKGMIIQLGDPQPGQPVQWVCTEAGVPGSWQPLSAAGAAPSIEAAPYYVGQLALAEGTVYVAAGTSSADDWHELASIA